MGLLEKADNIKSSEPGTKTAVKVTPAQAPKVKPDPTPAPVKSKVKPKKARTKKKRAKKQRVDKVLPEGFEESGTARKFGKWLIDLIVNYGLMSLLIGLFIVSYVDITWPLILLLLLTIFNIVGMPIWTGRSIGNWISMTQYINSRGNNPMVLFHIMKNTNVPFIFFGLVALMLAISSGTVWGTGMKIFVAGSLLLFMVPIADRFFRKFHAQNFGIWEYVFGGVWLVKSAKSKGSGNALLKRLESFSDFSESKGWMNDKDN
ncbi:MAG TPA: hypothetical protein EYP99_05515 [Candidatus Poseidoniales archaeon]|jgi:hypothetical protein|nr:hypothetical protein [Candidatus Poseidoniales archaeon]